MVAPLKLWFTCIPMPKCPLHLQVMRLRHSFSPLAVAHNVIPGDVDRLAAGEGRLGVRVGAMRPGRGVGAGYLEKRSPELADVIADGYSRRQYHDGALGVVSRIGRVLMNSRTPDLVAMRVCARSVIRG